MSQRLNCFLLHNMLYKKNSHNSWSDRYSIIIIIYLFYGKRKDNFLQATLNLNFEFIFINAT